MKIAHLVFKKISKPRQYLISILLVCSVACVCYLFSSLLGYRVVAYLLFITVSLVAMVFDILPVLLAAFLSAIIWDYVFIPPRFTLQVASAEDGGLLLMYFIIAMVNAVLTYKIRQIEKVARKKEERAGTVKLYNTLLNSLSHELRTPIAAIIGATDNLQTGNDRLSEQNKNDLVAEIAKAGIRLNQQVENLLSMSRLESGFLKPKNDWCDINEVIYATLRKLEENNICQKVIISINPNIPLFMLDKGLLEQILYNLLINATLYTPADSLIRISASCNADILELAVVDNGNGFPESEINNVFDKFYRLKNTQAGGTGLGLSIVKGFTEALGGTIQLKNIPEGGARFTVFIPALTTNLKGFKNE